jgi:hypothetical protein
MRRSMPSRACLCIASNVLVASVAWAQGQPPGTVTTSLAVTGVHQFDADLDEGGKVSWGSVSISGGVTRQMVPAFSAGVSARHIGEEWRMDGPAAFAGQAPWRDLQRTNVGLNLSLALSHTFLVGLNPVLEWARERGASANDALTYGAVVSAVKVVNPNLILGAGASVNRMFYSVKVSPFLIINWKWSDRFRITNALPAGPEGGAGIEASWTLTPDWEAAGGGVLRSDRYRLANDGPYAGLIGETASIPMFARLSRKLGPHLKADLYAGVLANGRLRIKDSDGNEVAHTNYPFAPAVAISLSFK